MKTGVECEYFIISPDGAAISDARDTQDKPCYDQSALMRRYEVITAICDAMLELGWGPYQNDHEDANGQFEMNWAYADALVTADRHAFFKFMVKTIAERHGLRATFMPKPFAHLTGNGCHVHVSLWDKNGRKNLFDDADGELGLSPLAYQFLGGVLHSAEALCALFNPTVNSYKRLNAPDHALGRHLGAERDQLRRQQPHPHGAHPRPRPLRVPPDGRRRQPLPDARRRCSPPASTASASKRDPGKRLDINMYTDGARARGVKQAAAQPARRDPRDPEEPDPARRRSATRSIDSYAKLKLRQWDSYSAAISPWEREQTLDC